MPLLLLSVLLLLQLQQQQQQSCCASTLLLLLLLLLVQVYEQHALANSSQLVRIQSLRRAASTRPSVTCARSGSQQLAS